MRRCAAIVLVLAGCHHAEAPAAQESVEASARQILTKKMFPFCDPEAGKYPMPQGERRWCEIGSEATTCPSIKASCALAAKEDAENACKEAAGTSSWADRLEKLIEGDNGGAADRFNWNLTRIHLFSKLLWALFIVLLVFVVTLIVLAILNRRRKSEEESNPVFAIFPPEFELSPQALGEVRALLLAARREASRDPARAIAYLYAAALKHLEEVGLIRWERSTTNRGYLRVIRGQTPLDAPVAEIVRVVEETQFGHAPPPTRSTFERLYEKIVALIPGAAILLIVVGLSGCDFGNPNLDGHAAFNELLRSRNIRPTRTAVSLDKLTRDDPPLFIDGEDTPISAEMLKSIGKAVDGGAHILLAVGVRQSFPEWPGVEVVTGEARRFRVTHEWKPGIDDKVEGVLPLIRQFSTDDDDEEADTDDGESESDGETEEELAVSSVDNYAIDVLLERTDGAPFAARWKNGHDGELVIVADDDLFANGALAVPANAQLAVALAKEVVGARHELAAFVLASESAAQSPADSLARAGLLPVLLQGLLALAILFWGRSIAFGALRDRSIRLRRSFHEHVAAVGRQFSESRGARFAASHYATYALEFLERRVGRGVRKKEALAQDVAARVHRPESEVRELLDAAEEHRREPRLKTPEQHDLDLIRRLDALLRTMRSADTSHSTDTSSP